MYVNDWKGTNSSSYDDAYKSFVGSVEFYNNSDSGIGAKTNTVSTDMTYAVYARNTLGSGIVIYPAYSSDVIYSVVIE